MVATPRGNNSSAVYELERKIKHKMSTEGMKTRENREATKLKSAAALASPWKPKKWRLGLATVTRSTPQPTRFA